MLALSPFAPCTGMGGAMADPAPAAMHAHHAQIAAAPMGDPAPAAHTQCPMMMIGHCAVFLPASGVVMVGGAPVLDAGAAAPLGGFLIGLQPEVESPPPKV